MIINNTDYVNTLWGSEVFTRLSQDKRSTKWFFYKPQIGNLSPALTLPNCGFSVVPYSGGYPTGYGKYNPSSCALPSSFTDTKCLSGFTHFCHSGTGYIGNFYNYFFIKLSDNLPIINEVCGLGNYRAETSDYTASASLNEAYASYEFVLKKETPIRIIAGYSGLNNARQKPIIHPFITETVDGYQCFRINYGTITLYFAIESDNTIICNNDAAEVVPIDGKINLKLAYSFKGWEDCIAKLQLIHPISAKELWSQKLSVIEIEGDESTKTLFYTALYNSLKKPCFDEDFPHYAYDFATLWDLYKTQLPLLFLLYPEIAKKCLVGIDKMFEGDTFDNARLMEVDNNKKFNKQSACIAPILIATAYKYGVKGDYKKLFEHAAADIAYHSRTRNIIKPRLTHNLDYCDAVSALKDCPVDLDKNIESLAKERLEKVYSRKGLLKKGLRISYYEGNNRNYSFRVSASTADRLHLHNKEKLLRLLDKFFGYGQRDVKNFDTPIKSARVTSYGNRVKRFEGLNNEPDMESMYLYHLLGEYKRCEEIIDSVIKHQFNIGDGGLCGNDDSGGISSWLVFNMLGLFPVAGTDKILLSKPHIKKAIIHLQNQLVISVENTGGSVTKITFNGKEIKERTLNVSEIKAGGELVFFLG